MTKWVYNFGAGVNDGNASLRNLLGGKGANLAEMASIDLPVPPGFTITTEVCTAYYDNGKNYPADLKAQVDTRAGADRSRGWPQVWRQGQAAAGFRALGRAGFHAGHDGHGAQPWPERYYRQGLAMGSGDRAFRVGFLSPVYPDVRLRRAGRGSSPV